MWKPLVTKAIHQRVGTPKVVDKLKDTYDYIIVGAGAAGNVLANRLTQNDKTNVLLVEAGGEAPELLSSDVDSGYKMVPQKRAMKERPEAYYSRKGLGISGSINNYLTYLRGSRLDYDEWEQLGCKGWSYRDVLPYFIHCEKNMNPEYIKSGYHGSSGPMLVSDLEKTPLVDFFLEAGRQIGCPTIDVNGQAQLGFSVTQAFVYNGVRWSTAQAYLRPAMDRTNLDVAVNTPVAKVLVEEQQATGVRVIRNGIEYDVRATREVILSAGAIESPKILMLSGIGPRDHLTSLNIPVVVNLPVGDNLQDHPMCALEYHIEKPLGATASEFQLNTQGTDYERFLRYTRGYLGMYGAQGAVAFFRTPWASSHYLYPDVLMQLSNSLAAGIFRKPAKGQEPMMEQREGIFLTSGVLHPKSRGDVRLQSINPTDQPRIDPKLLEHRDDLRSLIAGLKLQFQLLNSEAFQRVGIALSPTNDLGDKSTALYSEDFLDKYARRRTLTGHHVVGTCRMGTPTDKTTVVDPELRVLGVRNLRVVDASVMPVVPSGSTSAPSIMIAEKAADLLRGVNSVANIKLPDEVVVQVDNAQRAQAQA